eukprot:499480-Prorocentrum_minimum.AAC.3
MPRRATRFQVAQSRRNCDTSPARPFASFSTWLERAEQEEASLGFLERCQNPLPGRGRGSGESGKF